MDYLLMILLFLIIYYYSYNKNNKRIKEIIGYVTLGDQLSCIFTQLITQTME